MLFTNDSFILLLSESLKCPRCWLKRCLTKDSVLCLKVSIMYAKHPMSAPSSSHHLALEINISIPSFIQMSNIKPSNNKSQL